MQKMFTRIRARIFCAMQIITLDIIFQIYFMHNILKLMIEAEMQIIFNTDFSTFSKILSIQFQEIIITLN